MSSSAHAAGGGGDGAAARALPAVAGRHQEAHRGTHRAGVPRAHARRPQGVQLRRIGETLSVRATIRYCENNNITETFPRMLIYIKELL